MQDQKFDYIGSGIYTIPEASKYVGLNAQRVRHWFFQNSDSNSQFISTQIKPVDNQYAINFYDLIEVYQIAFLLSRGVSIRTIKQLHTSLKKKMKLNHPFCHVELLTDGFRIFRESADEVQEKELYDAISEQLFFPEYRKKLDKLEYSKINEMVCKWHISQGVQVQPQISFGKPVIANTGTTTYVVAKAFYANDKDTALVADMYQISNDDVLNAVAFEKQYGMLKAA